MTHKTQNKRTVVFVCDKYKNANAKRMKRVRKDEGWEAAVVNRRDANGDARESFSNITRAMTKEEKKYDIDSILTVVKLWYRWLNLINVYQNFLN